RIMLVGVRMQLLRLPAEGALDLRNARGLRYPKNIVGVTHPQLSPRQVAIVVRVPPQSYGFNVVGAGLYCNADRKGSAGPHRPPRSGRPSPWLRSNNGAFRGASFYSRRRGREMRRP